MCLCKTEGLEDMVRLLFCNKSPGSACTEERSHQSSIHSFKFELCSYGRSLLFLCGCVAKTVRAF